MKFILQTVLFSVLLLPTLNVRSQNTVSKNDLIESLIESITEQGDENLDYSNLLEEISQLLAHPVNLNTAIAEDLETLYFLNKNQIAGFLKYRENNGQILSIYELQLIPGFSFDLIRNIEPLVSLENSQYINLKTSRKSQQQILLRSERNFEKEEGFKTQEPNSKYLGSSYKYYTRYHFRSPKDRLRFGFTAEKDKGEAFFGKENSRGFDFYSGHVQYNGNGFIQQITLGDFQVKFGQGVNIWSGLAGGKSSMTTENACKSQGTKAYRSTDENRFFRGASLLLQPTAHIQLALFASSKKRDGNVKSDSLTSFISSMVNTGLHRNRNELNDKHKLGENMLGGYFMLIFNNLELGVSVLGYEYSPGLMNSGKSYDIYSFKGGRNYSTSFTYETQFRSVHLFGEAARSKSGGFGVLQGASIQASSQLSFELIYRKYQEDYNSHYSNAFAEQSKTQNEEGFYMGMEFNPLPKWTLKAYHDQFMFPWLKHSANAPSRGHEYFSQIEFTPNEKLSAYFRYRHKSKPKNNESEIIKSPVEVQTRQYRIHLSAKIDENWEIRNRLEFSNFKKEEKEENGLLIYQDIIYHFSKLPVTASLRYAIFDTDSFNTRIYAYENDILYAYSIPAFYSKGSRFYLNMNYKISRNCTFYARYAQTKYSNGTSIGSGTSKISGDTKSEIKLQLRFRF